MYHREGPSERWQRRPPDGFVIIQSSNLLGDEHHISDFPELGQEGTEVYFLRDQGDKQKPCLDHHLQPPPLFLLPRHRPVGRGIQH